MRSHKLTSSRKPVRGGRRIAEATGGRSTPSPQPDFIHSPDYGRVVDSLAFARGECNSFVASLGQNRDSVFSFQLVYLMCTRVQRARIAVSLAGPDSISTTARTKSMLARVSFFPSCGRFREGGLYDEPLVQADRHRPGPVIGSGDWSDDPYAPAILSPEREYVHARSPSDYSLPCR